MSLRDDFLRAQKDGYESLLVDDKKNISSTLAEFTEKVPAAMKDVIAVVRTGKELHYKHTEGLRTSLMPPVLPLPSIDQALLESLSGYRRLHQFCRSPQNDLCLSVTVTKAYDTTDRNRVPLAMISISIDPLRSFDASTLEIKDVTKSPVTVSIKRPLPADSETSSGPTKLSL